VSERAAVAPHFGRPRFPRYQGPFSLSRRLEGLETDAIGQAKENGQGLTPLPANVRRGGMGIGEVSYPGRPV